MTNDPVFQRLREISWRRKLTPAEAAELRLWLTQHPEDQADWEAEVALTHALTLLPAPEVPSNFTARVLQAVAREDAPKSETAVGTSWWGGLRRRWAWASGFAMASLVLVSGMILDNHQVQEQRQVAAREQLAKSVALISDVSSLPSAEVLADFEVIRVLNRAPQPDEQLLALLQ
jgi:anti-sigma factor RsiW